MSGYGFPWDDKEIVDDGVAVITELPEPTPTAKGCRGCAHNDGATVICHAMSVVGPPAAARSRNGCDINSEATR